MKTEKKYSINENNPEQCELTKILLANGLNIIKVSGYNNGKKYFTINARGKNYIQFDYINIVVFIDNMCCFQETEIGGHDLKCLLTFFNLCKRDREYDAYLYRLHDIVSYIDRQIYIMSKYGDILRKVEKKRIERIINTFNSIKI